MSYLLILIFVLVICIHHSSFVAASIATSAGSCSPCLVLTQNQPGASVCLAVEQDIAHFAAASFQGRDLHCQDQGRHGESITTLALQLVQEGYQRKLFQLRFLWCSLDRVSIADSTLSEIRKIPKTPTTCPRMAILWRLGARDWRGILPESLGWPYELSQVSQTIAEEVSCPTKSSQERQAEEELSSRFATRGTRMGIQSRRSSCLHQCQCSQCCRADIEGTGFCCQADGAASFGRCSKSFSQCPEGSCRRSDDPIAECSGEVAQCPRSSITCTSSQTESSQFMGQIHLRSCSAVEQAYGRLRSSRCRPRAGHSGSPGQVPRRQRSHGTVQGGCQCLRHQPCGSERSHGRRAHDRCHSEHPRRCACHDTELRQDQSQTSRDPCRSGCQEGQNRIRRRCSWGQAILWCTKFAAFWRGGGT